MCCIYSVYFPELFRIDSAMYSSQIKVNIFILDKTDKSECCQNAVLVFKEHLQSPRPLRYTAALTHLEQKVSVSTNFIKVF